MRTALVCGAGGFIGSHLSRRLKNEGAWVCGVDSRLPEFSLPAADEFVTADLRDPQECLAVIDRPYDEIYQLAADMGGAGYIFVGHHDAEIMTNSAKINLNVLTACRRRGVGRIFYSSSACVYPRYNQDNAEHPITSEGSAYPAAPDSEYGWEKLFSERVYLSYARNFGMTCRIARYHNIFGPDGTWRGGREKAPAALCRKVAEAVDGESIEIWGDGLQTRSFLFIDDCIEGTVRLMRSGYPKPVNIGSDEMVSINRLAAMIIEIGGKDLRLRHVPGPTGVRGRSSDNRLIRRHLGWVPATPLYEGLVATYRWIRDQVQNAEAGRIEAPGAL